MITGIDAAPAPWSGRDDGPGPEHDRWHSVIRPCPEPGAAVSIVGFASDEGVRRNLGRPGAAQGPAELRAALGSLAARVNDLADCGDVIVAGEDLEAGQARLGGVVAAILDAGGLPVVLGGGHEVAFGTYLGVRESARVRGGARVGVLNVDAHLDLRQAERASSGTPFRQLLTDAAERGLDVRYAAVGISAANNTRALFDTAAHFGVEILRDDACDPASIERFVDGFVAGVDVVHLTIDLDSLPAAVAPGVSAPAGFGVEVAGVRRVIDRVTASGKLLVLDVAELNPRFDVDHRTARTAARLIDEAVVGARGPRLAHAGFASTQPPDDLSSRHPQQPTDPRPAPSSLDHREPSDD